MKIDITAVRNLYDKICDIQFDRIEDLSDGEKTKYGICKRCGKTIYSLNDKQNKCFNCMLDIEELLFGNTYGRLTALGLYICNGNSFCKYETDTILLQCHCGGHIEMPLSRFLSGEFVVCPHCADSNSPTKKHLHNIFLDINRENLRVSSNNPPILDELWNRHRYKHAFATFYNWAVINNESVIGKTLTRKDNGKKYAAYNCYFS